MIIHITLSIVTRDMCGQVLIMVDHEIYTRLGSVQAAETYARQFMNSVNFRSDTTQGVPQIMPLCLAIALQQRSIFWKHRVYRKAIICLKTINNVQVQFDQEAKS